VAPFEIADYRAVPMIAAECLIIDANDVQWLDPRERAPAHDTEQCIIAHRYHELLIFAES